MSEIIVPDPASLLLDSLTLVSPAQVNRSSWTGRRKVIGMPGVEMWRGRLTIDSIATEEAERAWRKFLFALGGPQNWFRWPLPCQTHIGAKPTVGAGASNGYSLPLVGMQPGARILKAGQFLTVALPSTYNRTVCLTADLRADASGNATAQFRPALNELPAEGAAVETTDPYIAMSPTATELGFATSQGISAASIDVEEAFGPAAVGATPTFDDATTLFTFDEE